MRFPVRVSRFPSLVLALLASHAVAATVETEPLLDSAAIVQPALLSGPGFTVAPQAQVHGYMARFSLTTPYGPLSAESVELLALREAEIPAIETLEKASRSGAFAYALAEQARKTGKAFWQVVSQPIDTLTGLPRGVARYFTRQIDRWSNRAQSLSDRTARELGASGDPFAGAQTPLAAARAPLAAQYPPAQQDRPWYRSAGKEVGREIKRQLDYAKMRREMAKHLGVDPSSSNPLLRARLDELAWAAVVGNFSGGAALDAVTGPAAAVISATGQLNAMIFELDPENLREVNRARLARWCSDEFALRQFLRRGGFTDTLRTALADELDALGPRKGCNDLIEIGAGTRSELEARYLLNALKLIHKHGGDPDGEIFITGAAIAWRKPGGGIVLPLPLDWLSWTTDMADFFDLPQFREENKTVLVSGDVSMPAQRQLRARGWNVELRVVYPGSPAYADDLSQGLPQAAGDGDAPVPLCVGDIAQTAACL